MWGLGLFLRVRKLRKEQVRKQRFDDAMAALRTSAKTRLKNLHWDVMPTVDGKSQCGWQSPPLGPSVGVCVLVWACARACVRVCVRARALVAREVRL